MQNQQEERLQLLDFYFFFIGYASRKTLIDHFGVSSATASRDLKLYEESYPGQIAYSVRRRRYEPLTAFHSAFEHDTDDALMYLTTGKRSIKQQSGSSENKAHNKLPDGMNTQWVAAISRAISSSQVIDIDYAGAKSGYSTRHFSPHAFLTNGMSWYVRGYDRKREKFITFRLSRFLDIRQKTSHRLAEEGPECDAEWTRSVTLTIAPHPNHDNQEAFRRDLGLTDKPVFNLVVPSATAGFTLSALRVDCSTKATMDHNQFPYRCMNLHELNDVGSMMIAPGVN